jgi:hypothetical protein
VICIVCNGSMLPTWLLSSMTVDDRVTAFWPDEWNHVGITYCPAGRSRRIDTFHLSCTWWKYETTKSRSWQAQQPECRCELISTALISKSVALPEAIFTACNEKYGVSVVESTVCPKANFVWHGASSLAGAMAMLVEKTIMGNFHFGSYASARVSPAAQVSCRRQCLRSTCC